MPKRDVHSDSSTDASASAASTAAQATDSAASASASTVAAPADASAAEAVKPPYHVLFTAPKAVADGSRRRTTPVANVTLIGAMFDGAPIVVAGINMVLDAAKQYVVYMPGFGESRAIAAERVVIANPDPDDLDDDGNMRTSRPNPAGVKALRRLEDAIVSAWKDANRTAQATGENVYGRRWPLAI